jgi:hypothetical protein
MNEKAFVRMLNGTVVIFIEFRGSDNVAVSINGREHIMNRADWRGLQVAWGFV